MLVVNSKMSDIRAVKNNRKVYLIGTQKALDTGIIMPGMRMGSWHVKLSTLVLELKLMMHLSHTGSYTTGRKKAKRFTIRI